MLAQLLLPLREQRLGGEHQRRADNAPQRQFLVDEARLDGLAQADLIGENRGGSLLAQHLLDDTQLVGMGTHAVIERMRGEQAVEAGHLAQGLGAQAQRIPARASGCGEVASVGASEEIVWVGEGDPGRYSCQTRCSPSSRFTTANGQNRLRTPANRCSKTHLGA